MREPDEDYGDDDRFQEPEKIAVQMSPSRRPVFPLENEEGESRMEIVHLSVDTLGIVIDPVTAPEAHDAPDNPIQEILQDLGVFYRIEKEDDKAGDEDPGDIKKVTVQIQSSARCSRART